MRGRVFIKSIALSLAGLTLAERAQQAKSIRRIGILTGRADEPESLNWIRAFRERLAELGWTDGRNVRLELVADSDAERWEANARKMVSAAPDVIIVVGNPGVSALQKETRTIPIVFVQVGDPVGSGFVSS